MADNDILIDGKAIATKDRANVRWQRMLVGEAIAASVIVSAVTTSSSSPAIPAEALERVPGLSGQRQRGETVSLSVQALHEAVPALLRIADEHRSELVRLSTRAATLDDVFLALTGRTLAEPEQT